MTLNAWILSSCAVALLALNLATAADDTTATKTPEQLEIERLNAEAAKANAEAAKKNADTAAFKAQDEAEKARRQSETDKQKAIDDAEKARRQYEIDKLTAQKALITAATPTLPAGPSGKVSFEKDGVGSIENTVMAYRQMNKAAKEIATAIRKPTNGCKEANQGGDKDKNKDKECRAVYVIMGAVEGTAIAGVSVFESQTEMLKKRLGDLDAVQNKPEMKAPVEGSAAPSSFTDAVGLIGPSITAVAGLIALFRVDDKYVPKDETPDLPALYASVANEMSACKACLVFYPDGMHPLVLEEAKSPIATRLEEINTALDQLRTTYFSRIALKASAAALGAKIDEDIRNGALAIKTLTEIESLEKELKAAPGPKPDRKKEIEKTIAEKRKAIDALPNTTPMTKERLGGKETFAKQIKAFVDANDKYIAILEPVLKAGDDYIGAMLKADAGTVAPLTALIRAERLRRLLQKGADTTYAVQLSVQKLSGTRKEHTNFFGTSLSFSGGIVVSYLQFAAKLKDVPSGAIVTSGNIPMVSEFQKAKDVQGVGSQIK